MYTFFLIRYIAHEIFILNNGLKRTPLRSGHVTQEYSEFFCNLYFLVTSFLVHLIPCGTYVNVLYQLAIYLNIVIYQLTWENNCRSDKTL